MYLRVFVLSLAIFIASVNCQHDYYQHAINQTKLVHQIEKYGINIYPKLANLTDEDDHHRNFHRPAQWDQFNDASNARRARINENFINKTITGMPKGVCAKEVP